MEEQLKSIESIENMFKSFLDNSFSTISTALDKKDSIEFKNIFKMKFGKLVNSEYDRIIKNDGVIFIKLTDGHYDRYDDIDSLDKIRLFKHFIKEIS